MTVRSGLDILPFYYSFGIVKNRVPNASSIRSSWNHEIISTIKPPLSPSAIKTMDSFCEIEMCGTVDDADSFKIASNCSTLCKYMPCFTLESRVAVSFALDFFLMNSWHLPLLKSFIAVLKSMSYSLSSWNYR